MSLLNRLRPKLKNNDPDVRAEAVRELEKEEVDLLTAVAQTDTDIRVRRIAVKKLESPRHLLEISEKDEDESLRTFARTRARQLLVQIGCDNRDVEESQRALGLLEAPSDIAAVADKAHFDNVRASAFEALTDDSALAELVRRSKNPELRSRALERIREPVSLKSIVLDEDSGDLALTALGQLDDIASLETIVDHGAVSKTVRRQALAKLEKLVPEDHPIKVRKRDERYKEILKLVRALDESGDAGQTTELETLVSQWEELRALSEPSAALVEPFQEARERIRERGEKLKRNPQQLESISTTEGNTTTQGDTTQGTTAEPESEHADEARLALLRSVEELPEGDLEKTLEAARTQWNALGPSPDDALTQGFVIAKGEKRLSTTAKADERGRALVEFLEKAESIVKGGKLPATMREWQKLERTWPSFDGIADAEAKARYAHAEAVLADRKEKQRLDREAQDQAALTDIQAHLKKMAELAAMDVVLIKQAEKELRATQELLKTMGPLAPSVNRKKIRREISEAREKLFKKTQETRDIEEWKRWANVDIQNGLIARMEALRESKDVPKVAKEMRAIHEEWKKAGAAPAQKAEELWQKYKPIRNELKARCDEFFKKQNEERGVNLEKKVALCEKVEAQKDSEDWNKTADAIKELQNEWKTTGPVPQKKSDAIWKRFRNACDHFFERRKEHFGDLKGERDENFKKKEALCETAESLRDSTDWMKTVAELKRLQAEWRTIGAIPRKKSDQIWKRFRGACDHFFDRFKRRDEVDAEDKLKRREELVETAATFAAADPSEPDAVAEKVNELWTQWKSLGRLPDSGRDVQTRFEKIVSELVAKAPVAFANTDLDPTANRKKREKLVTRLESLVSGFKPDESSAGERNELEDLAARLKDALASNTIAGGKSRDRGQDWKEASLEVRRLRTNWLRVPPVPGDEGRVLGERFENAYRDFFAHKPSASR